MSRNGLIPPAPPGVAARGLQVEFISILAQAQKAVATERWTRLGKGKNCGGNDPIPAGRPSDHLVTKAGRRGRIDLLVRDLLTGAITGKEFKASATASLTEKQRLFLEDFLANGATIAGKGKDGFKGGLEIRPAAVHIDRKGKGIEHVNRPSRQD